MRTYEILNREHGTPCVVCGKPTQNYGDLVVRFRVVADDGKSWETNRDSPVCGECARNIAVRVMSDRLGRWLG